MLHCIKNRIVCNYKVLQQVTCVLGANMSIQIESVSPEPSLNNSNKKRLRVDEDENNAIKIQKVDVVKIKKRPYALMMGYLGRDYYGMQINRGMKTIEDDLLNALLKNNLITTENIENLRSFNFQRAARTDKGVSAARQLKLCLKIA
uniref:pseudouridylate synthase 1 homolog n=1 Tax=Vespula vulgaris TaxID=7454 RepID=UPI00223AF7FA|nr:pseudouridylate synthase 1 homolog [Vespula vulgaris]